MELSAFINTGIKAIQRGAVDRKSPYRLPILSNTFENRIFQRIVVARSFDEKKMQLTVFTDHASKKYKHLQVHPQCALLFWDARKKMQIQVNGKANFVDETDSYWDKLSDRQKREYAINPISGTKIASAKGYNYESEEARFAVLIIQFLNLEILVLDSEGHKRATCLLGKGRREEYWMSP